MRSRTGLWSRMMLWSGLLWSGSAAAAVLELSPGDDLVGLAESLQPGDEVILADGVYQVRGQIVVVVQSTEEAPLQLRAADGAAPIVELIPDEEGGYDNDILQIEESAWVEVSGITFRGSEGWEEAGHRGVQVVNSDHITLSSVEITQTAETSLYLSGTNTDITIERCHLHASLEGYGIYVGCSDASCWTSSSTITNSWIHNISAADGIYLAHGSQGITVSDTVMYDIAGRGMYLGSTEYGAANVIEGNALWGCGGEGLRVQGAALVRNNILFNIDGVGIFSSDPGRETFDDVVVSFNTVVQTGDWAVELEDWYDRDGMVLANNALCNPTGYAVASDAPDDDTGMPPSDNLLTANLACGLVEGLEEDAFAAGAGFADFVDVESWDLYPADADSALVNSADPSGATWVPEVDFNGAPREGQTPDRGAYEWSGGDNPGWALQEGFKELDQVDTVVEETVGEGCCQDQGSGSAALLLVPLVLLGAGARREERR